MYMWDLDMGVWFQDFGCVSMNESIQDLPDFFALC